MIDWGSFLLVAVVSIGSTAAVVALFSLGLRLRVGDGVAARVGAYAAFAIAALAVLFGIWLLIPGLHA